MKNNEQINVSLKCVSNNFLFFQDFVSMTLTVKMLRYVFFLFRVHELNSFYHYFYNYSVYCKRYQLFVQHIAYNRFYMITFITIKLKQWPSCEGAMEQQPSGEGAEFPIQRSQVQNLWVAPRSTQRFILPRLIS